MEDCGSVRVARIPPYPSPPNDLLPPAFAKETSMQPTGKPSRRDFLKTSAVAALGASTLNIARMAHAQGSDTFKIALVGCGGRGTGAAYQALQAQGPGGKFNVKLVAMADAFRDRLDTCHKSLMREEACRDKIDVPEDRKFSGLDAHKRAMETDADVVLLCSPPGFRPGQYEAAVAAGKHVFMEKPLATDGPGVRRILAANEEAKKKNLAVVVGFHMRHEANRREVTKLLQDGAIGDVHTLRAYYNCSGVWHHTRQPGENEMQYQVRNWYYFTWLSGDHIAEQHVHDLDICNWIKQAHPIQANGMGGRQVRIGPDYGEIFDHHAVEFTYPDGAKLLSFCRHIPNCWESFSQHAHGARGTAELIGHGRMTLLVDGQKRRRWERGEDGHQTEHNHLFSAIAAGEPLNETESAAHSSMTAILGRMATYSGKIVTWDDGLNSQLDLSPTGEGWDAQPRPKPGPDGCYPCAVPGVTKAF
ncbi:MAG: Gfo/Idh/MocA family oxidoreductase [Pirellulales bacterium]|nr:Gfo/Idh/MocA family oxidoreductase [Pirellulales bacterium]